MNYKNIKRKLTKFLPKKLYSRTLIIIITPMLVLQTVVAYVFMERHWQMINEHLSSAVANDIAALIDIIDNFPGKENYEKISNIAENKLQLHIDLLPLENLPIVSPKPFFSTLDYFLSKKISEKIHKKFWIDTVGNSNLIEIRIVLAHNILRVFANRAQTYRSNTIIFLIWMAGTAFVLLAIAIYFLKLQIRPIQHLASVAEKFGRGEHLRGYFPKGAEEVRRAGIAFLRMRQRVERQMEQKSMMLSGVSHDLRTILTRFRLELSLFSNQIDISELEQDVIDMTKMIDGYLAFVRGEGDQVLTFFNLNGLAKKIKKTASLHNCEFIYNIMCNPIIQVRPNDFTRLINNLVTNSFKYATNIEFTAKKIGTSLIIYIDDNGPGIPDNMYLEVFKPFFRINNARTQDLAGTGLGLSIALDVARSHGGNLTLEKSPLGGLRAIIYLPD